MQLPKVKPRLGQSRQAAQRALDLQESRKVRKRSGGRCEVHEQAVVPGGIVYVLRCIRPAMHVMHLIGGHGKRGIGISALAEHKLHGCAEHHREIDGNIPGGAKLKRIGGPVPYYMDVYERVR